jgi:hypothetical protein
MLMLRVSALLVACFSALAAQAEGAASIPDGIICTSTDSHSSTRMVFYLSQVEQPSGIPLPTAHYGTPYLRNPVSDPASVLHPWTIDVDVDGQTIRAINLPGGYTNTDCAGGTPFQQLASNGQLVHTISAQPTVPSGSPVTVPPPGTPSPTSAGRFQILALVLGQAGYLDVLLDTTTGQTWGYSTNQRQWQALPFNPAVPPKPPGAAPPPGAPNPDSVGRFQVAAAGTVISPPGYLAELIDTITGQTWAYSINQREWEALSFNPAVPQKPTE